MKPFGPTRGIYSAFVDLLVDARELIPRGDDIYEDMGGHLVRFEHLEGYIEEYLKILSPKEREEVILLAEAIKDDYLNR